MAAEDWVDATPAEPAAPRTWADTAKSGLQTADDFMRATANALTFGMADRFAGYMNSGGPQTLSVITGQKPLSYDEAVNAEVAKSQAARERSPYASITGDVVGSAMLPGFGAESLAARYGSGALARAGAYGGIGALTGAAQGAGSTYTGNLPDYVRNATIGAALGAPLGAVGGAVFGSRPSVPRAGTPTEEQLHDVAQAGYNAVANSPARYEPGPFRAMGDDVADRLYNQRFTERDAPYAWRGVGEIRGEGAPSQPNLGYGAPIAPADIEWVRQGLNRTPRTPDAANDRAAGQVVRNALDDFVTNPPRGAVLPGLEKDAEIAARQTREASGNWAGYKRVQALNDLIENAGNAAGSANSGLNLENNLRQAVKGFVRQKGGASQATREGYNADEIAALKQYSRGLTSSNLLRWGANMLGGGGMMGIPVGAGLGYSSQYFKDDPEMGRLIGVGAPILGTALRMAGNRRANTNINALRDTIAQRTPLYDYRATMGMVPGSGQPRTAKAVRDAISTAIIKQTAPQERLYVSPGKDEWE